jgi:hypothetical protein
MDKDIKTLNTLMETSHLLAYIEKVKKEYLEQKNISLNLHQISSYMEQFVASKGASEIYIKIMLETIANYYEVNGDMKY